MKRNLVLALLILLGRSAQAQPPVIVPGVYVAGIYNEPAATLNVSSAGTSIAINYGSENYAFVDITTGTFRQPMRDLRGISPDHRYAYVSTSLIDTALSKGGKYVYVWGTRVAGLFSDTVRKDFANGYYAWGANTQGQLIVTKALAGEALKGKIVMGGLYTMDAATGRILKTLRTDSIKECGLGTDCSFPDRIVQKDYAAIIHRNMAGSKGQGIHVYPFNSSEVVTIALSDTETVMNRFADSSYIYALSGVRYTGKGVHYTGIHAYSRRTGKLVAAKSWPDAGYPRMVYAFANNRIYRYDMEEATAYEERVTGSDIQIIKSWKAPASFELPKEQRWWMGVCKGPSLFFAPHKLEVAEQGGAAANRASLLHLPSAKVTFSIFPFYVRTPAIAAAQAAEQAKVDQYWADKMSPAGKAAENLKSQRYKAGTMLKRQGTLTESAADFIVIGFDAPTAHYIVLQREFVDARNTFFKTDDNIAFYNVSKKTMKGYDLDRMSEVYGKVDVCPACTGSGVVKEDVVHTRGGKWEQVGFNIEVYTPAHVIASWKERAICPKCNHTGVLPKR